ncbi:MAG: hypothetical protein HDT41_03280 [Lachnospiraceae bacterium]|nr:hypothetical protein [Lachnospiraceae bacterium]
MKKNKKMLGIALAGAMVVMCAVPVKAASTSWAFDNSAHAFGVINRTGSAGVYSAWLAGSNVGAVTKAYFSVGNGDKVDNVKGRTKLTYPENKDKYRGVNFNAKDNKSIIVLYDGTTQKTQATAN